MTAHPSSGRGDKDDRYGLVSVEEECIGQCTDSRLSRGSGPDQQPHQDPEIMASDVDQVALVTLSRPRSQVRRMPPRSRLWAKDRSTISARRRIACLPPT